MVRKGSMIKLVLNSNNYKGCKEATLISYHKHVREAKDGFIPIKGAFDYTSYHQVGLFGAIWSRYRIRGFHKEYLSSLENQFNIWAELFPFLKMPEEDSVDALLEYVLFQESQEGSYLGTVFPNPITEVNISFLKNTINKTIQGVLKSKHKKSAYNLQYMKQALNNRADWYKLLTSDVKNLIYDLIQENGDDSPEPVIK